MTKQKSPTELAAEASSEDKLSFVRRVKRATGRRSSLAPHVLRGKTQVGTRGGENGYVRFGRSAHTL